MDVLMLSGELAGGAPQVMYQISKHFPSYISTTVGYLGGRDELSHKFEQINVPVIRIAERPFSPPPIRKVNSLLRNQSPDLVHTHMISAGLLGRPIAAFHDIPAIHTVHTNYQMRPLAAKYLDVLSAPFGQCAVCVSNSVEQSLPPYYLSDKEVIHNCIDVSELTYDDEFRWESLGWTDKLNPDAPLVANVARYDPKKRRHDIIKAFSSVVDKYPNAQLVLTGRCDGRESRLVTLAHELDIDENVFFVGFVENPRSVYYHADVIVFGSESEGFSIGLLEAMASQRPIIATDIPAFVEALGEDYRGLVPVRSPTKLGEMIANTIGSTSLQERMLETASRRIEPFTGANAAMKYIDLYHKYTSGGV